MKNEIWARKRSRVRNPGRASKLLQLGLETSPWILSLDCSQMESVRGGPGLPAKDSVPREHSARCIHQEPQLPALGIHLHPPPNIPSDSEWESKGAATFREANATVSRDRLVLSVSPEQPFAPS